MARRMLVGWKRISDALDVIERTAQKYAARKDDPLPVHALDRNQIAAWADEVDAWRERNQHGRVRKDRTIISRDAA